MKLKNRDQVILLSLMHMLHDIYTAFLAPILPIIKANFALDNFQISIIGVVRELPSFFSMILGVLIDKLGEKHTKYLLAGMPIMTAILMSLIGIAPSYNILLILLFFAGISTTIFHIVGPPAIKEVSKDNVGEGISFFQIGGEGARFLGPIVVLFVVAKLGLKGIVSLIPVGIVLSFVLYYGIKDITIHSGVKKSKNREWKKFFREHIALVLNLGAIQFFWRFTSIGLTLFLPLYLKEVKEVSIWSAGGALAALQFFGVVGTFMGGRLSDKKGKEFTILASIGMTFILMGIFLFIKNIYLIYLIISFLGFFLYFINPILLTIVQEKGGENIIMLNSFYKTVSVINKTVVLLMVGKLSDIIGLKTTFIMAQFLLLLVIPLVIILRRSKN